MVLFGLSSCQETPAPEPPTPPTPSDGLTITISSSNITDVAADITFTPNPTGEYYYADYFSVTQYNELFTSDADILESFHTEIVDEAAFRDITVEEFIMTVLPKDVVTLSADGLLPNTEYYVLAVGIDTKGEFTTEIFKHKFTTLETETPPQLTFTFAASNITTNSFDIEITPSNLEDSYYFGITTAEVLDAVGGPDALVEASLRQINDLIELNGHDPNDVFAAITNVGVQSDMIDKLTAGTDYYVYAFGLTDKGVATSEATISEVITTEQGVAQSITFTAQNITATTAEIVCTPTNNDSRYYVAHMTEEVIESYGGRDAIAQLLADAIANLIEERGDDPISVYTALTNLGAYTYPIDDLTPETEYIAFAFGLNTTGEVTSETFFSEPFTTLAETPPADYGSFTVTASNATSYSFDLDIQATNQETKFYVGALQTIRYQEDYSSDPNAAAQGFIDLGNSLGSDYWTAAWAPLEAGSGIYNTADDLFYTLESETPYSFFVFGVSPEGIRTTEVATTTGTTLAVEPSDNTFNIYISNVDYTSAIGEITVTNATDKYYTTAIEETTADAMTDDEIIAHLIEEAGFLIEYELISGDKIVEYDNLTSGTRYYAVAFGCHVSGVPTTALTKKGFQTNTEGIGAPEAPRVESTKAIPTRPKYYRKAELPKPAPKAPKSPYENLLR